MRWILLALIFISGIYYLTVHKKKIKEEEQKRVEQVKKETEVLPVKTEKIYVMSFSKDTIAIIKSLTRDVNPEVRFASVEILWQIQEESAPAIIRQMFEMETEDSVRKKIIGMLEKDKSKISLSLLGEALKHYDKDTRIRTVQALGKFTNKEAIPVLNIALNDYDEDVKIAALKAINNIRSVIEQHKEMQLKQKENKPLFKVE